MANPLMDRIDRGLRRLDLHELAELYSRAHDKERDADEPLPRLFFKILRRHISLTVSEKLAKGGDDDVR